VTRLWLWSLWGCGGALSQDEVAAFLDAHSSLLPDVEARLDEVETEARHGEGDGDYVFEGVMEGSTLWTGTVSISGTGTVEGEGTVLDYDLSLAYDEVTIEDVGMDGAADTVVSIVIEDGQVTIAYGVVGELDLSGSARGHATMDYSFSASSSQPLTYAGTVNGRDVSDLE
jgi:hypothetical protein